VVDQFKSTVTVSTPGLKLSVYLSQSDLGGKNQVTCGLLEAIEEYGIKPGGSVVGCVAWLSNCEVLDAMARCRRAMLIVNSEHFDDGLKEKYDRIPNWDEPLCVAFSHLETPIKALEKGRISGRSAYKSVRCFGSPSFTAGRNANDRASGLQHNKYLVFFEKRPYENRRTKEIEMRDYPCAVWTGSANMTKLSEKHKENAVLIVNDEVAKVYFDGWAQIFMNCSTLESASKKAKQQRDKNAYKRRYPRTNSSRSVGTGQTNDANLDPGPLLWSPGLYRQC